METYDFKFGKHADNDPHLGIRKGRITISNQELKPPFDDVVTKILNSCLNSLVRQKTKVIYHNPPPCILLMSSSTSFSLVDLRSRPMCVESFHESWADTTCKLLWLETTRE
jgi:hypothetical protein